MPIKNNQKTIFIVVSRGFIARNILRCGVLDLLKKSGFKIIIFFLLYKDKQVPNDLRQEFECKEVIVEGAVQPNVKKISERIHRVFKKFASLLIFTRSTRSYIKMGNAANLERNSFLMHLEILIFSVLGQFAFLKKIIRFIEENFFVYSIYEKYFNIYKPDIVFSTSIVSKFDILFMKEARKRGVKTISMPKGWDNVSKNLYLFVPDALIVQNEIMKEAAIKDQKIRPEIINVCGFPQFDIYRRKDLIFDRNDYFKLLNIDPSHRLIFFGSGGIWTPSDHLIVQKLAKFVSEPNLLIKPSCLLIRSHFTDAKKRRFDFLAGKKNIRIDQNFNFSNFFPDNWNPTIDETRIFINSLFHCDIMVMIASTLALDACCFDKPIIGVAFNALFDPKTGYDISPNLYETDHYEAVCQTGAIDLVKNEEELRISINKYLINSRIKTNQRKLLLSRLCYRTDGQSSERIVRVIKKQMNNNE